MIMHPELDRIAVDGGGVRVLHPLRLREGPTGEGAGRGVHVGIAIDVETTSLDPAKGKVIELAVRRFRYDRDCVITDVDEAYEWREDPGEPLPPEISALTNLTDDDLEGHEIDEGDVTRLLQSASFVVAHNAGFDRRWVENRLPDVRGMPWVCSMRQVDWRARGFDGRVLGYLLLQYGYYHCGHRASADVDALIQMLRHRNGEGRTALSELIERGAASSWLVRATGAHFDLKDPLRDQGFSWDPDLKVWAKEVSDHELMPTQFWLAANVYSVAARAKALGPELIRITPRTRFL
jgi:DNA polymerase III subunit epsilon